MCDGPVSCTNETVVKEETYLGGNDGYGPVILADCPGVGKTGEEGDGPYCCLSRDGPSISNIVDVLKTELKEANIIVLCINSTDHRYFFDSIRPGVGDYARA